MGYTHYWNLKQVPKDYKEKAFKSYLEIQHLITQLPEYSQTAGEYFKEDKMILRGGDGTGLPEITKDYISFNGDSKRRLDYETFYFDFKKPVNQFSFCKTARKPYDQAVCLCLLSLANYIDGFEFSSDGDKDDWEPIINFYNQHVPSQSQNLKDNVTKL